jgi:hypothetical protein
LSRQNGRIMWHFLWLFYDPRPTWRDLIAHNRPWQPPALIEFARPSGSSWQHRRPKNNLICVK